MQKRPRKNDSAHRPHLENGRETRLRKVVAAPWLKNMVDMLLGLGLESTVCAIQRIGAKVYPDIRPAQAGFYLLIHDEKDDGREDNKTNKQNLITQGKVKAKSKTDYENSRRAENSDSRVKRHNRKATDSLMQK